MSGRRAMGTVRIHLDVSEVKPREVQDLQRQIKRATLMLADVLARIDAFQKRLEAAPLDAFGSGNAEQVRDRGEHVHLRNGIRHPLRGGGEPRHPHHHRHVRGGPIEEVAVRRLAVIAEVPRDVWNDLATRLAAGRWTNRADRLLRGFFYHEFPIQGLDAPMAALYRRVGWLFFTRPALVLLVASAAFGVAAISSGLVRTP